MFPDDHSTPEQVDRRVRAWLQRFVVGLNLCPFARPVVSSEALRVVVCEATEHQDITAVFMTELDLIQRSPESMVATTLLAIPYALLDFEEYLGFIEEAESLLEAVGLSGVIQLASFHPAYQFEGEPTASAGHYTNRAPFPLIHFLREEMMTRVLDQFPDPEQIPQRNIQRLEALGVATIEQMLKSLP
ncbi:DUF1415 domain-containing protein [Luminiphilus sp.]|nr:DUF1415 domain-containing protein [Luminiphilus sp.]